MRPAVVLTSTLLISLAGTTYAFDLDSIFVLENDLLAVEAEDCYAGSYWKLDRQYPGYTGKGYMRYDGPDNLACVAGQNDREAPTDTEGTCQTDPRKRLRIPVRIPVRGSYHMNIRIWPTTSGAGPQAHVPGKDHTAWLNVEELGWGNACSGHTEDGVRNKWTWFSFGPGSNMFPLAHCSFTLEPGDYVFYVGGRHHNFRADRIHIYRKIGRDAFPAQDTVASAPVAQKVPYAEATSVRPVGLRRAHHRGSAASATMAYSIDGRRLANRPGAAMHLRCVYLTDGTARRLVLPRQ